MKHNGTILFNDNWLFALTAPDSDISALGNANWYNVKLPADWLINDTARLYESGCGWYKKSFAASAPAENEACFICFDGVYMDTTVYVNGKKAGEWKYGYTSFYFDITRLVTDGENEILVRVNHKSPNSRWYSGAGIFRNVYLRRTSACHIQQDGIYISTKRRASKEDEPADRWKVSVAVQFNRNICGTAIYTVKNPDGTELLSLECRICGDSDKQKLYLADPMLWDTENPHLYGLEVVIKDDTGKVLDSASDTFGLRKVEFTRDKRLLLNGKSTPIKGVCMHHDLGALGAAVNYDATRRQLCILKEYGVNAVRTSHNPPSRELLKLCDEMGILVNDEIFDMWEIAKTEYDYARFFDKWYKTDVAAWIKRDRNHPCVIMWSVGNEIPDTHKSQRGAEITRKLKNAVLEYDPLKNAHCTIASNYMQWENAQKCADELKLAGYNYAERLYKEHSEQYPDWYIYGSETASTVRSRGIYHFPFDAPRLVCEDMQCSDLGNSVVNWGASPERSFIDDRDSVSMGQFVWTGFDYIGEPTPYSTKNSYFGIVDTAGFAKDAFYFYKSVWDSKAEPFVHIVPTYWDFNDGQLIDVIVYTNTSAVGLFVDNEQYGEIRPVSRQSGENIFAHFIVPYKKGSAIKARGYDENGREIACDKRESYKGEPVCLVLKRDYPDADKAVAADGTSLVFFEITAEDENGNAVLNANNRVRLTVGGPARLVGLDNGDSTDYDSYKGDNRRLFSGRLLAIIQTTAKAGTVTVKAESIGLTPAEAAFDTVPCEIPEGVSVEAENPFPSAQTEYTNEIPIRKIELFCDGGKTLTPENKLVKVGYKILPENATYNDIEFICISQTGNQTNNAAVASSDKESVTVEGLGDGQFRLRAFAKNGSDIPKVLSELEMEVQGMGQAQKNPYEFISASLYDYSSKPVSVIERGALGGFDGRTIIGFKSVDFSLAGAQGVTLSIGNCTGSDVRVDMYLDAPDGEHAGSFDFADNNGWDRGYPVSYSLPRIIKGMHDIFFKMDMGCIFSGIQFEEYDKAYSRISAADNDGVYGDDFAVNNGRVEKIGNNVVLEFKSMNFKDGTDKITVVGKTSLDSCTVQLRFTDENGAQTAQAIEFPHSEEYTEHSFTIEKVSGRQDVSFIFLPGSKFDFDSFEFIRCE